ncbi:MAG: RusA family crossover junction endodeoxyribonuclease, partial [Planktothrix sp.]
ETRRGSSLPESEMILSESTPTIPEQLEVLESPVTRIQINPTESSIDVEFTAINPAETPPIDPPKPPKKSAEIIKLIIPGVVVPKARPRVTRNGTYLPPRYRAWRNHAEVEIYRQISEQNITHKFPLRKAAIVIKLFGNHRTNSDIDNLAGACLDALTLNGAGVLIDDRLSCLPQLTVEFDPDAKKTGVSIEIEPL